MPVLEIISLTCRKTTAEAKDEIYINAAIDGRHSERIWGPTKFNDGDSHGVNYRCEFNNSLQFQVREDDRRHDDFIGNVNVDSSLSNNEERSVRLTGSRSVYIIYYRVGDDSAFQYEVEFVSIACLDARESRDEVYLTLNGNRVWGINKMRTGDTQTISRRVGFRNSACIELWEEDTGSDDRINVLNVSAEPTDGTASHRFVWRKSRTRDAIYELRYIVRRI